METHPLWAPARVAPGLERLVFFSDAPSIFAFALSFLILAAFWLAHYRIFRAIARSDGWLIAIDFVFLFCVVLLPFPTSIMAREGNLPAAAILYACFGLVAGLASALLWIYPARIGCLMSPAITPTIARHVTYRTLIAPLAFAVSIPVALVSPTAAELCWLFAFPVQALVSRRLGIGPTLDAALREPAPTAATASGGDSSAATP